MCIRDSYKYHHSDKTPIPNTMHNRDNYKMHYTPPVHNTTTRTATDTERVNTAKQRVESDQLMKTELHDGKNYKGGVVWSSNRKRFSKPYDKGVAAVRKDGEWTTKREDVYKRQLL